VVTEIVATINHLETALCTTAERAFLRRLEGGCQVPIGALARLDGDQLLLSGFVGSLDGSTAYRNTLRGSASNAGDLGCHLAESFIARGAAALLAAGRVESRGAWGVVL